jgi:hypothetical protein
MQLQAINFRTDTKPTQIRKPYLSETSTNFPLLTTKRTGA